MLSYDLELSPVVGSVAGDLLAEIAAVMGELRAEGTLELTHGPWVGDGMGFAAAGTKLEFPVGDGFRQRLPQYPGTAPVATGYASVSLGGSANLRLEMLAYDGRLVMEDEPISLTVAGVSDVLSRTKGQTRTTINYAAATFNALAAINRTRVSDSQRAELFIHKGRLLE